MALGANGTVTVTGKLAVAGGNCRDPVCAREYGGGLGGGQGTLGPTTCQRSSKAFTSCTVTYTAPVDDRGDRCDLPGGQRPTDRRPRTESEILLNTAGVTSNPAAHQGQLPTLMPLGSSGGNNNDFDAHGNTIADCCSGTLGALIQDNSGKQYLLSNNHVLARSDHATVGDAIVQPGPDRQQLHSQRRGSGNGAGGRADRMAAAQIRRRPMPMRPLRRWLRARWMRPAPSSNWARGRPTERWPRHRRAFRRPAAKAKPPGCR